MATTEQHDQTLAKPAWPHGDDERRGNGDAIDLTEEDRRREHEQSTDTGMRDRDDTGMRDRDDTGMRDSDHDERLQRLERERDERLARDAESDHEGERVRKLQPKRGAGFAIRLVLSLAVLAAIVVFAAVNTEEVELDYLADTATSPQWWIIAASAVAGLVLGRLLPRTGKVKVREPVVDHH